jgi:hypothetical protein
MPASRNLELCDAAGKAGRGSLSEGGLPVTDEETEIRSLSVHEMGHVMTCWHFDIAAIPTVELREDGTIVNGYCWRERDGDPWAISCISWAGVVAECLLDCPCPGRTRHVWKLTEQNLVPWGWSVLYHYRELSLPDQIGIHKYFDPLKSLRFAFKLLSNQREELDRLAKEFAETIPAQIEVKRTAFERAKREREEQDAAFKAWEADGFKLSAAYRAEMLSDYLAGLPPDDPKRRELEPMLASLRGREPLENTFSEPPPNHGAEPPPAPLPSTGD